MAAMIITVRIPKEVECITQNGKTYCEKQILTPEARADQNKRDGIMILIFVLWMVLLYFLIERDAPKYLTGLLAILPLVILGLCLILS